MADWQARRRAQQAARWRAEYLAAHVLRLSATEGLWLNLLAVHILARRNTFTRLRSLA